MDCIDTIISVIDSSKEKPFGRTVLQKLLYFASELRILEATFFPHYYGPYSEDVSGALSSVVSLNLVEEEYAGKGYTYTQTKEGMEIIESIKQENPEGYKSVKNIVEVCDNVAGLDPYILAGAAKIHYILSREKRPMKLVEIRNEAPKLGWKLSPDQIAKASNLLQRLELVKTE